MSLILGLLLFAQSGHAGPTFPDTVASDRFRSEIQSADPYILEVLRQHEAAFPGVFVNKDLHYYTEVSRISRVQQNILAKFLAKPKFLEDMKKVRKNLTDFRVEVAAPLTIVSTGLQKSNWSDLLWSMRSRISKGAEEWEKIFGHFPDAKRVMDHLRYRATGFVEGEKEKGFDARDLLVYVMAGTILRQDTSLKSVTDLKDKIEKLDVGSLDYLEDSKSYLPLLKELSDKFEDKDWTALMKSLHKLYRDQIYRDTEMNLKAGSFITIREVHPNFAIFRGYVGNDCATDFSPGFTLTPYDQYFYVFNEKNEPLGYVGLTNVIVAGKKALFMHTIQGPGFSAAQTEMVMRGFHDALRSFDAKRLMLARTSNIEDNVNYMSIEKTMVAAVEGVEFQPMKFSDMKYREVIVDNESTWNYDDPRKNQEGRQLEYKDSHVKVEVTQRAFNPDFTTPLPEAERPKKRSCSVLDSDFGNDWGPWGGSDY